MRRLRDAKSRVQCPQTTVTSRYDKLDALDVDISVNERGWWCNDQSCHASSSDSEVSDPTVYRHYNCGWCNGTEPRSSYAIAIQLEIEPRPGHRARGGPGCWNTSLARHSRYLLPLGPQTSQGEAANIVPSDWLWKLDCGAQVTARVWYPWSVGYGREETKWSFPSFTSIVP